MATDKEILEAAAKNAAWIIKLEAKVQELEGFIKEIRDELLYPLSFNSTHLGQVAEGFGSCIPKLLEENDDHL
jgi:hypothetical protein